MTIPSRGMPPPIDDELLSAYLDGQVSPDERAAVEAAMAADPGVRARLTDLRATVALLRALPQPAPRRTFILTPEQAAAIRPVRVPWLTRIFPAVAAVGAVAAVLCLALIAGDLATGGFATKQRQATVGRTAIEAAGDAAASRVTTGAAAPAAIPALQPAATAAPAVAAANAPAPAGATAAALAPASNAAAGSAVPNRAAQAESPTVVPAASPTAIAAAQQPPPVATKETHRVPIALVRAGEILLALLGVAGVTLALLGRRKVTRA